MTSECNSTLALERRLPHGTLVLICAGLVLIAGSTVYLFDRPAFHAQLMPFANAWAGDHPFGSLGQWLPSFLHPLAFSLFTAVALRPSRRPAYGGCVLWCVVNVLFEIGQHPAVSARVVVVSAGLADLPIGRQIAHYLVRGTFDVGDIVAAVFGSLTAAGVLWSIHKRKESI